MRAYIPGYDLRVPASLSEALGLLLARTGNLAAVRRRHRPDGAARSRQTFSQAISEPVETGELHGIEVLPDSRDAGRADDVHRDSEEFRSPGGISAAVFRGAGDRQRCHAKSRHARRKYRERFASGRFSSRAAGLRRGNRTDFRARGALGAVSRVPHRLQENAARSGRIAVCTFACRAGSSNGGSITGRWARARRRQFPKFVSRGPR